MFQIPPDKPQSILMICFGILSMFSSIIVVFFCVIVEKVLGNRDIFLHFASFIAISDFFLSLGFSFGLLRYHSPACILQAALVQIFSMASLFWIWLMTWFVFRILYFERQGIKLFWWNHVLIWGAAVTLFLIPLESDGIGGVWPYSQRALAVRMCGYFPTRKQQPKGPYAVPVSNNWWDIVYLYPAEIAWFSAGLIAICVQLKIENLIHTNPQLSVKMRYMTLYYLAYTLSSIPIMSFNGYILPYRFDKQTPLLLGLLHVLGASSGLFNCIVFLVIENKEAIMALRILYHRRYGLRDFGGRDFPSNDSSDDSIVRVDTHPTTGALEGIQRQMEQCLSSENVIADDSVNLQMEEIDAVQPV